MAIIETGAGSDDDLVDTLERLLPRDDRYRHAHGSFGHGADHVMPAIVAPSITVPVQAGEPLLGTWQSVVLVDLNRDNPRRSVRLSFSQRLIRSRIVECSGVITGPVLWCGRNRPARSRRRGSGEVQTHEIRKRFLDHFVNAGHTEVPSASVILDDPNLLFVNAGMVQFVPFFLGQRTPPYPTATSIQKCIRTPDIDEVGITTRHNTFFQMAGNFSFGDYFKRGAIELAWTLLTNKVDDGGYGLDPEKTLGHSLFR